FSGFFAEGRKYAHRLLILGAGYAICFAIIKLLAHLVMGEPPPVPSEGFDVSDSKTSAEFAEFLILNTMFMAVASVPVIMAFWFAPALVIWHNMPPAKALFASSVAVWRNKTTFVIYGMGWLIMVIGAASILSFFLGALGLGPALQGAFHILTAALVMAFSLCTVYPSYRSILEKDTGEHIDVVV
ncbi:MAG: BPSS1780 family membrane protein, partial [Limnobacter sp.]|nr:BPSS1780 family membrane protein [Limnobacter sp.]